MDEEELELQRAAAMLAARSCLPRPQAALTCRAARHGHVCGGHVSVECAVAYRSRQQSGVTPFDICLRPAAPHACFTHLRSVCLWALPLPSSKKEARPEKRGVSTDKATDGQTARMFSPSEWTEGGGAEGVRLPAFSLSPIPPDPNRTFEGEETGILI